VKIGKFNRRIFGRLTPKGRPHLVGAVLEPIPVAAFALIGGSLADRRPARGRRPRQ
jgi:hypothetical protein